LFVDIFYVSFYIINGGKNEEKKSSYYFTFIFIIFTGLVNSQQKSQQKILKPKLEKRPVYNDLTIKTLNCPKNIKPEQPSTQGLLNPDVLPDLVVTNVNTVIMADQKHHLFFRIKNMNWTSPSAKIDPSLANRLCVRLYRLVEGNEQIIYFDNNEIVELNTYGLVDFRPLWEDTGSNNIEVTVDYNNLVSESNEGNNSFVWTLNIDIGTPNGGERWAIGSDKTIGWRSIGFDSSKKMRIDLLKNGTKIGTIFSGLDIGSGDLAITWKAGKYEGGMATPGSGYKIRITTLSMQYTYQSQNSFTLLKSGFHLLPRAPLKYLSKKPDLTLSDVRIESDGGIRWLRFIIKNENWKNSEISLNDPHTLSVQIYALGKRAQVLGLSQSNIDYINQHGSTQIQFPWDYTEDTKITVDYGHVVDESNERNNTFILRQ